MSNDLQRLTASEMRVRLESRKAYWVNLTLPCSVNWHCTGVHLTKRHSSDNLLSPLLFQSSLSDAPLTWLATFRPSPMSEHSSMLLWLPHWAPSLKFRLILPQLLSSIQTSTTIGERQFCSVPGLRDPCHMRQFNPASLAGAGKPNNTCLLIYSKSLLAAEIWGTKGKWLT